MVQGVVVITQPSLVLDGGYDVGALYDNMLHAHLALLQDLEHLSKQMT